MSVLYVDTINEKTSGNGIIVPGHVLQVVHNVYETEQSLAISANVDVATGLTASITPKSSSSKILIQYALTTSGNNTGAAYGVFHRPYHDVGQTGTFTAANTRYFGARSGQYSTYQMVTFGGHLEHSPNTTSTIDYKVYVQNNNAQTVYINRSGSSDGGINGISYFTLMEIGG